MKRVLQPISAFYAIEEFVEYGILFYGVLFYGILFSCNKKIISPGSWT
jgi:hypothetical protein